MRIRLALTDLGTTFIKLGQILGNRPDLVGPEVAAELSDLQCRTPADPPETVISLVEKELARPIGECFVEFDHQAMASASIGQVHRARLHNGRPVVVKVQHLGASVIAMRLLWLSRRSNHRNNSSTLQRTADPL